jgi:hypothetical protein
MVGGGAILSWEHGRARKERSAVARTRETNGIGPAPRLKDVAEIAGVSVKTVSNVVNDAPHVASGTRARVQAAIDALGYHPNATARRLRTGRSGVIALASPSCPRPTSRNWRSR